LQFFYGWIYRAWNKYFCGLSAFAKISKISWLPACHRKDSILQKYYGFPPATRRITWRLSVFAKISWLPACHRKGSLWAVSFCKNIMAPLLPQEGSSMRSVSFCKNIGKGLASGLSGFCKNIMAPRLPQEGSGKWSVRFLQKYHGFPPVTGSITCSLTGFAKISWLPACHRKGLACGLYSFCKNIMASRLPQGRV
jgi:hypothetical protein